MHATVRARSGGDQEPGNPSRSSVSDRSPTTWAFVGCLVGYTSRNAGSEAEQQELKPILQNRMTVSQAAT